MTLFIIWNQYIYIFNGLIYIQKHEEKEYDLNDPTQSNALNGWSELGVDTPLQMLSRFAGSMSNRTCAQKYAKGSLCLIGFPLLSF